MAAKSARKHSTFYNCTNCGRNLTMIRSRILLILSIILVATVACRSKPATREDKAVKSGKPVATAEQKIESLKLSPPGEGPKTRTIATSKPKDKKIIEEKATLPALPAPSILTQGPKEEPIEIPFTPKLISGAPSVEILIDASGSMAAPFGATNDNKIDLVKDALIEALLSLSDSQSDFPRNVALRVFGSRKPSDFEDCKDTKLLYPLGKPDIKRLVNKVNNINAMGMSPLSLSIESAKQDMKFTKGDRLLVIITDGSDNCDKSPAEAINLLVQSGQDWIVHIVGFDLSPKDQEIMSSLAAKGSGKLYLARTVDELFVALDQALNASLPYNLRLITEAGGLPLPVEFTVFKAGNKQVIRKDKSYGTKLLFLKPGGYDILVEYAGSAETKRPSKLLKGVEVTEQTKVEQTISFDLAGLGLTAIDPQGYTAPAAFKVFKSGSDEIVAEFESGTQRQVYFITPGKYDVSAELLSGEKGFVVSRANIVLESGKTVDEEYRFQKGTLVLSGATTQKTPLAFVFRAFSLDNPNELVASGALPQDGGSIELYPGKYNLILIGDDKHFPAAPRTKLSNVSIIAGETTTLAATFNMGMLNVMAVDAKSKSIPAIFTVYEENSDQPMGDDSSDGKQRAVFYLPPATYKIVAISTEGIAEPKPQVIKKGIILKGDKTESLDIKFNIGTLRLRGRNTKEQPLITEFIIYNSGTDEVASSAPPSEDWTSFPLMPGKYDINATHVVSSEIIQANIWLRSVDIQEAKIASLEAIFTDGQLKIMGRGPNNEIINCKFKIFKYGADREIIYGETGNDWKIFSINPGSYYMEASYNDQKQSVLLKKWVNIEIKENEVKEEILRF